MKIYFMGVLGGLENLLNLYSCKTNYYLQIKNIKILVPECINLKIVNPLNLHGLNYYYLIERVPENFI